MRHTIAHAPTFTTLEFQLDEGEWMSAQPGCMLAMTTGIEVKAGAVVEARDLMVTLEGEEPGQVYRK